MNRPLYLHTHEFFPKYGGISTYCHEFAAAAARLGHAVTVCGPRSAAIPKPSANSPAYTLLPERFHSGHDPLNSIRSRASLIRRFKEAPDALHLLAEPGPILALGLLARHRAQPSVRVILHGSEICRWSSPANPARQLARRALARAEKIYTVSSAVRQALITAFPEISAKASFVHPALPEDFRLRALAGHDGRLAAAPPPLGTMHLLSVGRLHPRKGFQEILSALAALPPHVRASIRYTLAGARSDDVYLAELRARAEATNVTVNWQLDPDPATLFGLYEQAHVFALTSLPHKRSIEGFGLVYAEAGSAGLPCLAYATGGAAEAVLDSITGYVLPVGDIRGLSHRLLHFYNQPEARQSMGRTGRQRALSRTWETVVQSVIGENDVNSE